MSRTHRTHASYVSRLRRFIHSLPETMIRFMYFEKDMDRPVIKDTFKEWRDQEAYILSGKSDNYCYVYQPRGVAELMVGDARVYCGDHVTFGLVPGRDDVVYARTHWTTYEPSEFEVNKYYRTRAECNFTFDRAALAVPATAFLASTRCENIRSAVVGMSTMYADRLPESAVIHALCVVAGAPATGGRRRRRKQRGGAVAQYKGITFMTAAFEAFIVSRLVRRLRLAKPDLEAATLLFDEERNDNIIMFYDFEFGERNIFFINSVMALTACYASTAPELEPNEQAASVAFEQLATAIVAQA